MQKTKFKQTEIGKIPENWETKLLGSLITKIFCGRDPKGGKSSHSNKVTDYRIIQSAPVFDGYLETEKVGYISRETFLELKSAEVKENDVLLNQLGDGITFARSCVVPNDILPAVITRSVGCIRCNIDLIDPFYLNAFLILPKTKEYIESFNSGSSRRAIDGSKMKQFLIPLPKIEEQRKIGELYSTLQKKIGLNNELNKSLEKLSKLLFERWFVDFEFPNEKGKPYKSSGGEMVYNEELGKEIPKGWKLGKLSDLVENIKSALKAGEHLKNRKYVPIDHLPMKYVGLNSYLSYKEAKSSLISFEKNDILFGAMRAYFHRVVLSPFAGITRTTTFVLRPRNDEHIAYSLMLINQDSTIEYANSHSKGSTMPYAVWNNSLENMSVIIPENRVLQTFNELLMPILSKLRDSIFEQNRLSETRDLLLPKLMSGEIRVK